VLWHLVFDVFGMSMATSSSHSLLFSFLFSAFSLSFLFWFLTFFVLCFLVSWLSWFVHSNNCFVFSKLCHTSHWHCLQLGCNKNHRHCMSNRYQAKWDCHRCFCKFLIIEFPIFFPSFYQEHLNVCIVSMRQTVRFSQMSMKQNVMQWISVLTRMDRLLWESFL